MDSSGTRGHIKPQNLDLDLKTLIQVQARFYFNIQEKIKNFGVFVEVTYLGVAKNVSSTSGHITQKMRFEMRFEIEVSESQGLLIAFGDGKVRNKFLCFIDEKRLHLFQSSLRLVTKREKTHGYVFNCYKGYNYFKKISFV